MTDKTDSSCPVCSALAQGHDTLGTARSCWPCLFLCVCATPVVLTTPSYFFQIYLCWEALPSHQSRGAEGGFTPAGKVPLILLPTSYESSAMPLTHRHVELSALLYTWEPPASQKPLGHLRH